MDDSLLFFLTGDPTKLLGVSQDKDLVSDAGRLSIVGERILGSLSMGWRTDRLRCAIGVDSSREGGDRLFRSALVSLLPDSEYTGDFSIKSDEVIGGDDGKGESTVEISRSAGLSDLSTFIHYNLRESNREIKPDG